MFLRNKSSGKKLNTDKHKTSTCQYSESVCSTFVDCNGDNFKRLHVATDIT